MNKPCLVIDIGNTVMHWGLSLDGENFVELGKLRHFEADQLMHSVKTRVNEAPHVLVGSVNPKPMPLLRNHVRDEWNADFMELQTGHNWHPEVHVEHPSEVGVDRLLNARALKEIHPEGGIVVDHGTALTIDFIDKEGSYAGGTIVPGIVMSTRALAERTSLIPRITFDKPDAVVGKTTEECIRSGLYYGLVGLVQHIVDKIQEEQGRSLPIVVTGGDAAFIQRELKSPSDYLPCLTLDGLLKAGFDAKFWAT